MEALECQVRQKMENRRQMMSYFADLRSKVLSTAIPTIVVTPDGVNYKYSESVEEALSHIDEMEKHFYETECKEECGKSIRL